MKQEETIPGELIWQHDGHVTEVAVTAVADGQEGILPTGALEHVQTCPDCHIRVGAAALLSLRAHEELQGVREVRSARTEAAIPWGWMASAFVVAAVGSVPWVLETPMRVARIGWIWVHDVPLLVQGGRQLMRGVPPQWGTALFVLLLGASTVLAVAGIGIARVMARTRMVQGGA